MTVNISSEIRAQLKGRPCEVYSEAMRVRAPADLFTYPDVVVVCGEPRFDDGEFDTLPPLAEVYDRVFFL